MKSIKITSTLKTLPTSKTITSENQPKFLVIILTENQNAEFQQFCLEIYDQTFYLPDQNLAEIQIVDSYDEFLSMEKQQNKEYFILSSDKAIDENQDVLNARQRWVLYDSSKKGTSKNINDLPNVVYRTRQIKSLRQKLQSRKFICKQKLINQKYRQIYEKQLKRQQQMQRTLKQSTKNNYQQQKDTFIPPKSRTQQRVENRRLKEEQNDKKNVIGDQNNNKINDQKKIKIIKSKTNTILSNRLLKSQRQQIITPNSYCHNNNVDLQVKRQVDQFKKSKSNEIFTLSKTYSDYESDSNLHLVSNLPLMSTNINHLSQTHNNNNHSQQMKENKTKRQSKTPQQYYLNEAKISNINNQFSSLYIDSNVKKTQQQNQLIDNKKYNKKYKHLKTQSTQHNQSSNQFLYLDSINANDQNNNDDDYQIQKVVLAKNSQITQNNNTQNKKHKLKFSQHQQLNHHHIPLSSERSSSLNHFINRKSIYDHNLNNNITKINKLPKNQIQMKLHRSKSKLKARSLLTAKSLKSKELNSSKQNFTEIKKKHQGKVKIIPKRYLPTEKKDDHKKKLRNLNEEMSTIQSQEYKKSPFKTHREKIVDNFRSKKSLFFQNSQRKIHFSKDYEQSNLKSTPLENKQQLSALYLVSHLKSQHFINELESIICCNDSVFRFKTINQLKNQIKQSENVYQLIFVFNQPLFSHEEFHQLYKLNKSCYFVDIDQSIEGFQVLQNKVRIKGLNYFNNAFDSITNERKFRKK